MNGWNGDSATEKSLQSRHGLPGVPGRWGTGQGGGTSAGAGGEAAGALPGMRQVLPVHQRGRPRRGDGARVNPAPAPPGQRSRSGVEKSVNNQSTE